MARELILERGGRQSRFGLGKVDRIKLYGQRRRIPLDPQDQACERAELTADGSLVLRSGMTAQAYFDDDGVWIPQSELQSLTADGQVAEKHDSTLGVPVALEAVDPGAVLDSQISAVYALDPEEVDPELKAALDRGEIFRFPFNYRAGTNVQSAFLVANPGGVFALVGQPAESEWCELARPVVDVFEDEDEDADDLDFEMF